ncbi:zinc ribbon domain-containing protein [Streptomyces sp. Ru73]|uniref:NADase-type glycan-binding domain-containing protein n=1 Tax=Streptomyces sp. Ru73 TaxID=2080748 RepID=UPI000CDE5194|nr:zinc ribbon domain-containing protein [Streptomyces sp. Ru73]POX42237.1 zinc ribbon domain-containing protein [Streptomyces sp. Ru73]
MTDHNSASSAAGGRPADCPECGTRTAPGQSFCDGCGTVLGWKPPKFVTEAPGPSAAPAEPEQPAAARDTTARETPARDTTGPEETTLRQDTVSADADTAPQGAVDPRGPAEAQPASGAQPDAAGADERARALLIPVADPEARAAAEPAVAPVLPGRPEAARPVAQGPAYDPSEEGGTPCPWCSTGNRPDRHFCRRCAMSLDARPEGPARRLPWWRRILDRRNRPAPWAGTRPRLRRDLGRILSWTFRLIVVGLVVFAAFNIGTAVDAVRDHFAKRAPVDPDSYAASRSYEDHGDKLAFDKFNNTWWGPGVSESGKGEWIEARFQEPVRLLDLMITPGISTKPADLTKAALPHRIDALVTTADGHHFTKPLVLDRASGPQRVDFRVGDVSSVRFVVQSSYNSGSDKQVSFAEIEFFGRSHSSSS